MTAQSAFIGNSMAATCYYSVSAAESLRSSDTTLSQRTCWQAFINWSWSAYGFQKSYWDDGFGYYDVCNESKALARAMNAIYLATYSDSWTPSGYGDWGGSILRWGQAYAYDRVDRTRMKCDLGGALADFSGSRMRWSMRGMYDPQAPSGTYVAGGMWDRALHRAATIIHESRHADKGHDGGGSCPNGASCDTTWGYNGANRWMLVWYWWWAFDSQIGNSAQSDIALATAALIRDGFFNTRPSLSIPTTYNRSSGSFSVLLP
ncbi:MAG: hypothetical protein AAF449_18010 [Myxococcota bacterium]